MIMENPIDIFIKSAYEAGMPRDQLENFLKCKYVPFPWQLKFHSQTRAIDKSEVVDIGVGGARGPGKSHCVFAQVSLDDCQRVSGLKALFLRQTGKSARESFEDLIGTILRNKIKHEYNISTGTVRFPNHSRILLGGFENDKDIDKYVGIEYDVIAVEELNQITKEKIDKLKGSLRTSKPNWKPRFYASFNPGGMGHGWIKDHFVIPQRENREIKTKFFPATYKDNPCLNKEYIDYLNGLTGNLGKAWREGNWDIFEGQYFNEWNEKIHTCEPFEIPADWRRYRSYDHGRKNPACCLWHAIDYDGRDYVYRELYVKDLNADEIAREIVRLSVGENYHYSVADPSIFSNTGFTDRRSGAETIAEVFANNGIMFSPASNRRVDGWNTVHRYLAGERPQLQVFKTCYNGIRTIPTLIHDDHQPEDVETLGDDHWADSLRYLLQTLHERKTAKPLTDIEKKMKEHNKPFNFNDFYLNKC